MSDLNFETKLAGQVNYEFAPFEPMGSAEMTFRQGLSLKQYKTNALRFEVGLGSNQIINKQYTATVCDKSDEGEKNCTRIQGYKPTFVEVYFGWRDKSGAKGNIKTDGLIGIQFAKYQLEGWKVASKSTTHKQFSAIVSHLPTLRMQRSYTIMINGNPGPLMGANLDIRGFPVADTSEFAFSAGIFTGTEF